MRLSTFCGLHRDTEQFQCFNDKVIGAALKNRLAVVKQREVKSTDDKSTFSQDF
jgi:hypothetical protein